jgi:phosphoribosylformylglycinamidine synthase
MPAEWNSLNLKEPAEIPIADYSEVLSKLMSNINICSRENIIRKYDHEVKGRSVIKPLMGEKGIQPQDAAVMRINHTNFEGLAISNGIMPKFGDIDAYQMSLGAFDEAVRQIIAVGGRLPNLSVNDETFWTVNDNFCVPDSYYHPEKNPDGKEKLAKLVQMCEGLYEMATFYDIPMTSGKDSMKNDFKAEGIKISVPPTILYSMVSKIEDVRGTVTSEFKKAGDLIYQLGETYEELGGSEFYKMHGELGANVPKVRKEMAKELYLKVMKANELNLIESAHDISDGGLVVALAECVLGTDFGINVHMDSLENLSLNTKLFAESHSRFVVSVNPENKEKFENIFKDRQFYLGEITDNKKFEVAQNSKTIIQLTISDLESNWRNGLM